MRTWLELHDSRLDFIESVDEGLSLHLHGYIHEWRRTESGWKGRGLWQPVGIHITEGIQTSDQLISLPCDISRGRLQAGSLIFDGLIPMPLIADGKTRIYLELQSGEQVVASGTRVQLEPIGEAVFVEDLPADMLPLDAE